MSCATNFFSERAFLFFRFSTFTFFLNIKMKSEDNLLEEHNSGTHNGRRSSDSIRFYFNIWDARFETSQYHPIETSNTFTAKEINEFFDALHQFLDSKGYAKTLRALASISRVFCVYITGLMFVMSISNILQLGIQETKMFSVIPWGFVFLMIVLQVCLCKLLWINSRFRIFAEGSRENDIYQERGWEWVCSLTECLLFTKSNIFDQNRSSLSIQICLTFGYDSETRNFVPSPKNERVPTTHPGAFLKKIAGCVEDSKYYLKMKTFHILLGIWLAFLMLSGIYAVAFHRSRSPDLTLSILMTLVMVLFFPTLYFGIKTDLIDKHQLRKRVLDLIQQENLILESGRLRWHAPKEFPEDLCLMIIGPRECESAE
jgi:hypothetical protein